MRGLEAARAMLNAEPRYNKSLWQYPEFRDGTSVAPFQLRYQSLSRIHVNQSILRN